MTDEELSVALDEVVHDLKAEEAAKINNGGLESQLAYLGVSRDEAEESFLT